MHRAGVVCLKADRGSAGPVTIPLMEDVSCATSASGEQVRVKQNARRGDFIWGLLPKLRATVFRLSAAHAATQESFY